jgi:hypothetical protein
MTQRGCAVIKNVLPWSMSVSLVGFLVKVETLGEPRGGRQVEGSALGAEQVLGDVVVGKVGPEHDEK